MKIPILTHSTDASVGLNKVCVSNNQLKAISNRQSFARHVRPTTQMRAQVATMQMASTLEAPPSHSTPLNVEKYVGLPPPVHQKLERSMFNLYEKPSYKQSFSTETVPKNYDRSMLNQVLKLEKQQIKVPPMHSNQNLKHSVFNLYAQPIIPEKPEQSENSLQRSVMNLYLEDEQKTRDSAQGVSRSVFNLSQNIQVPETQPIGHQSYDNSMMNLYLN